jgi:tetratricopeptide (TPR) repeat protein
MMQGRSAQALKFARQTTEEIPVEFLDNYPFIADGFMAVVPETQMRFGRWEEILREPEPRQDMFLARALWRFARAVSFTALNRKDEAMAEREAFARAAKAVPQDRAMGNNSAADILAIAELVLDGEMRASQNDLVGSQSKLQQAVRLEDQLKYDEPPDWIQAVRHTLGAVLMRAGRTSEAEGVYREDLQRNPENGWALMGLRDALKRQGKQHEAATVERRLIRSWAHADVSPKSTCYCQEGK